MAATAVALHLPLPHVYHFVGHCILKFFFVTEYICEIKSFSVGVLFKWYVCCQFGVHELDIDVMRQLQLAVKKPLVDSFEFIFNSLSCDLIAGHTGYSLVHVYYNLVVIAFQVLM